MRQAAPASAKPGTVLGAVPGAVLRAVLGAVLGAGRWGGAPLEHGELLGRDPGEQLVLVGEEALVVVLAVVRVGVERSACMAKLPLAHSADAADSPPA